MPKKLFWIDNKRAEHQYKIYTTYVPLLPVRYHIPVLNVSKQITHHGSQP